MTEVLPFDLPVLFDELPFGYKTKGGVYCYTCLVNGKNYVGSAFLLSRRLAQHDYDLVKNADNSKYLQNAWNKYGLNNFVRKVLAFVELTGDKTVDGKLLTDAEDIWIERLDACNPEKGYNIRKKAHTNLGLTRTAETKALLSEKRRARPPISEETREKLRNSCKNSLAAIAARERNRERNTARLISPENLALAIAGWTPEKRVKQGEAIRVARWTPEAKEKQSAQLREQHVRIREQKALRAKEDDDCFYDMMYAPWYVNGVLDHPELGVT